ncbi:hypothetical protein O181_032689 [Austropuccinia psidii MF-1]|uniref:Uncharacterized protein n=1 Tax=Austropuccinia psidii MF-1 TaxID=1389203 RepID=A0A9Q3CXA4_9BASI|nr:hypothetical protein [Austropuccinia psidii MF-1]
MEGFTNSTSSPSNLPLPSASGLVGESMILPICFNTPWFLIIEIRTSEQDQIGLLPVGMGPPILVQLSNSLCLDPVTKARNQYHIKPRRPKHLQLELPEVPSGLGASGTGNSFPNGPSFLLNIYHLTLEGGNPGC